MKQVFELFLMYGYKGASCTFVKIKEEDYIITAYNNYNEKMFYGSSSDFVDFLYKLKNDGFK